MIDFTYYNPAKIIFGRSSEEVIGREVKNLGDRVLLVYGGDTVGKLGILGKVTQSLAAEGIEYVALGGVQPNPRLSSVEEGIRLCRLHGLNAVLAIGGGSPIDAAKAIAAGVPYEGCVWDFFDGTAQPKSALPVAVVLTIAAAGSECSDGSVVTKEEGLLKRPCNSVHIIPKLAILNPEYTVSLPPYQTACGGSDILAHLIEHYFTQVTHVDYTDRLLEATMRTILTYVPLALDDPGDYDIRAEIMWAGTLAQNNLLCTGRRGDWGSHMVEHELSAIYDIAHGAGMAIVIPAWMKYVWHESPSRFVQFAQRVFDIDLPAAEQDLIVAQGIGRLEGWYRSIGLPVRLGDAGIDESRLREMARKCCQDGPRGNLMKLYEEDVYRIYQLAL
jgi:alcohol dehydrogenase YqhD (iron-dependent ADH family)